MPETIELSIQIHTETFQLCLIILFLFAVIYNHLVAWLEQNGHDKGYMSGFVSLGCAVTIAVGLYLPTKNLTITALVFAAFVASGLPMIIGSIIRYIKARAQDEHATREDLREQL